jgi:hypothetical protein
LAFLYELERGKPTVRIDKVLAVLTVLMARLAEVSFKRISHA